MYNLAPGGTVPAHRSRPRVMFVAAIVFLVIALVALFFRTRTYTIPGRPATPGREARPVVPTRRPNLIAAWTAATAGVLFVGLTLGSALYAQDTGESKVQVDISGNIVGQTTDSGFHFKAPWATLHTFNIRNQTVTYINAVNGSDSDNNGNVRSKSAGDNGSLIVVPQGTDNVLSLPGTSGSKSK
ncbi:hypothetical protein [Curtobacterium sp. VKM Ac-1376]|uniref:hypothetical protein n=1 Tax=Curtobacterium sp. VKM Ac-1376 TaxID=123312 RepID=UPI00188C3A06|nr:hypothetical protein [Curtobacterium sp. VKM Ac-1376]MBF4616057.1 hypothetical protein [Curtobacterium sp. VKM Ac-1376]